MYNQTAQLYSYKISQLLFSKILCKFFHCCSVIPRTLNIRQFLIQFLDKILIVFYCLFSNSTLFDKQLWIKTQYVPSFCRTFDFLIKHRIVSRPTSS